MIQHLTSLKHWLGKSSLMPSTMTDGYKEWSASTCEPLKLTLKFSFEPYCYHCYRRESQLEAGMKLNACRHCLLASFCPSCQQSHPSAECGTLQDITTDDEIKLGLYQGPEDFQRIEDSRITYLTKLPKEQYTPLSSANDWYDYYTNLSDMGHLRSRMNRDIRYLANDAKERQLIDYTRCSTNTMSFQMTLIAALEAALHNVSTQSSILLHIIGAARAECADLNKFEALLHLLPSLTALQVTFVGLDVPIDLIDDIGTDDPRKLGCCTTCREKGRSISISAWRILYHEYVSTEFFKMPDLAAAFQSGFSVAEQADWSPTINYLAAAPHPTMFTAIRNFEIQGEMHVWKELGVEFIQNAEINKWKGMSPSLAMGGDRPNEVIYRNYWWYIVKARYLGSIRAHEVKERLLTSQGTMAHVMSPDS